MQCKNMPNFSFSAANNFLRFTPESLDEIRKRIAEKKLKRAKALEEGKGEQQEENLQPQLDLKVLKKLPHIYGKPPPWLIAEPLEDVDPYYKDHETCMALSARRRIFRFTATKALFLFSPFHPLRRLAIKILIHTLFITFITCVVLCNCIFMTLNEPPNDYNIAEISFTVVYTVEFAIKVVARGFVLNEFTYLRDLWNVLDLFTLIMTYASLCLPFGSISALRSFRVLRTLKAVSVIPGLKVIIASLLQSVKKLANVMLLTVFSLAVFALTGLQLFMGNLKYKCVHQDFINKSLSKNSSLCLLKDPENYSIYQKTDDSSSPLLCGYTSNPNKSECRTNYFCVKHGDNPDYGYTSFDHFGWAFLSMFRLMTQDSWEILYQQVLRTSGKTYVIFFVIVIFLCSFYLFNLILAVVTMAYDEQHKATLAHTKAREILLQKAKEVLKKEKERIAQQHSASMDEDAEMLGVETKKKKEKKRRKKKRKGKKSKTYGEDETMFYSTPDKSQKDLKELLMSYQLPSDTLQDPFQRQKLTSAANVISKTMEWEEPKLEFPPGMKKTAQKYLIWQCCPFWLQIKEIMKKVMINPFMELFISLCITVNTLLMALEDMPFPHKVVEQGNNVFTGIFTAEMVLKIIALDPYYYFQDTWNIFDSVVVVIGIVNLILKKHLSIVRMLRIFKLSKFWPALNKLMKIILKSVGPLGNLTLVLIFTIFIFAVVGKQAFGSYYKNVASGATPNCLICIDDKLQNCNTTNQKVCKLRWHMEDFFHSFLIIFRILCREWIETMWGCMKVAGEGGCIILFMMVLVFGNLVVLNLFIALLLSSFSSSDSENDTNEKEPKQQEALALIHKGLQAVKDFLWSKCCNVLMQKLKRVSTKNKKGTIAIQKSIVTEAEERIQENCVTNETFRLGKQPPLDGKQEDVWTYSDAFVCIPLAETETLSEEEECVIMESDYSKQEYQLRNRREIFNRSRQRLSSQYSERSSVCSLDITKRLDHDSSCSEASTVDNRSPVFLLPVKKKEPKDCFPQALTKFFPCCRVNTNKFPCNTWWNFRKTCYRIVKHSWFESFSIFMILLSSGALIFEDIYLDKRKHIKTILEYADIFFFYIFFLEMFLKWMAYGFRSYFTNGWCCLDFFIVCFSIPVQTVLQKQKYLCDNSISTKSLRTLRALRPLRALSRFKGIKVVVNALAGAIPSIGNVLLVCIVLWLPFNILGVQLFRGKFWSCNSSVPVVNRNDCVQINAPVNFDNVMKGYLALLQVATFKGWMEIMYAAVDAPSNDKDLPCFENNQFAYIYFVVFIVFGSFFMLNLFIGVVIDNFNQQRKKLGGELIFLSEDQKKYYNALKKLGTKKPLKPVPRPLNTCQGILYDIVSKQGFDIFIISLIFLNVVIMAVEHEDQNPEVKKLLETINLVFVALFTGECIMKMLALRAYFFRDNWNIFDFVVVILSILSSASTQLGTRFNFPPTILRIIRVARVSRLLRVIRGARGLRTLLFALLMSLPALTNIGLLLFLIMFIYAIFGMGNFACASLKGGIDNIFNFQTFGGSMLCLFEITTSAGWHSLLNPMLDSSSNSICSGPSQKKGPCVNRGVAISYFVSYIIISFLIVVNMYIAVIIENLNVATEESTEPLGDDDFEIFYEVWARFDPEATQFISYSALSDFADALVEPLRVPKPNGQQLMAMGLPMVNGNKIHCLDILFAFTKRVLGEAGEMDVLETKIEEKYPEKIAYEPIVTTPKRKQEESAVIIQRAFRKHLLHLAIKKSCQEASVGSLFKNIPEEEDGSVYMINESEEDSGSDDSQSPACVLIPPSYSNATAGDIPQVKIKDCSNDDTK
ncbi:sodium channel protein type 5 subunit alpha-like [Sceloporus undulatus]|uniref:sodium channel protein type 5 subunit alpha-like n=1 Tax=Sceloporus undulatus TaxID=8520 RepID=UPI001C4CBE38|nr:sodium channel protein type 5 subunit alpha-like [Sceloporus undulatus]